MPLLSVQNLKSYYILGDEVVKAVDDVSFEMEKGEIVTFVGESGSGKSTLGLSIIRLLPYPGKIIDGKIIFKGRDLLELSEKEMSKIRGKEISSVFQDPLTSLDPLMRVGDQIVETITTHFDITKEEAKSQARKYLELVGIPAERYYDYPHQFSGGMRQRAMIAMAIATQPSLIIADEPTTALDVIVQAQIMQLFRRLRDELGVSIILITHDISLAMEVSDKIGVMYAGHLVEYGSTIKIYEDPLHPYTKGLLEAVPNIEAEVTEFKYIPGNPPDLTSPPSGCRFHPRCRYATEKCKRQEPKIVVRNGRLVKCHLYGDEA